MRKISEAEEWAIRMWIQHITETMDGVTLRDKRNKYRRAVKHDR